MNKMRKFIEITKENEQAVLDALKSAGIEGHVIHTANLYFPVIELEVANYFRDHKKDVEKNHKKFNPEMTLEAYTESLIDHVATQVYKYGDISEDIQNQIDFTNNWSLI